MRERTDERTDGRSGEPALRQRRPTSLTLKRQLNPTEGGVGRLAGKAQGLILAALFSFLLVPSGPLQADESCASGQQKQIHIGRQTFAVSLADTEPKRLRGLSGRRELTAGSGMWFVFPSPSYYGFWMQEMHFPIDLIWIGANRSVVGAVTLQPCQAQPCPTTLPPAPVTHVLEINAGEFAGRTGDAVTWSCVKPPRN